MTSQLKMLRFYWPNIKQDLLILTVHVVYDENVIACLYMKNIQCYMNLMNSILLLSQLQVQKFNV